jgi:serine phosphatase RsbU (regulator of sigma subunit)
MGPGVTGIVLADISGKGMSGALLMANLQANLRSQYAVGLDDLPRLLQSVNHLFYENTTDESYATMFFAVYEDSSRKLRYANCGHVAPLIVRADGSIQHLTSTTTVLGLFLKWASPIEEETLQAGDVLVVCTDGVTEAPNSQGEEYGDVRLADVVRQNNGLPVDELLGVIQSTVQEFSSATQADDITLIVARCR